MNTLSIDIGNSKIKLDYWANEGILFRTEYDFFPFDEIKKSVEDLSVSGIIVSSVRKDNEEIIHKLKDKSGCHLIVDFNQEEIRKYYKERIRYSGNIGPDRVGAFLGAEIIKSLTSKLIVDAGTALTLDISDKEGNYIGGNISLGLYSRMKALAMSTEKLPQISDIDYPHPFGEDTATAITAGAKNGVIGEVLYTIGEALKVYNIEWVIVTGGDYKYFSSNIRQEFKNCFYDEYLVGRGLNWHLRKIYFPEVFMQTKFFPSI